MGARPRPCGRPAARRRLPFVTGAALLFALLAEPTPAAGAGAASLHGIQVEPRPLPSTLGVPPHRTSASRSLVFLFSNRASWHDGAPAGNAQNRSTEAFFFCRPNPFVARLAPRSPGRKTRAPRTRRVERHFYDSQASDTFSCLDGKKTLPWSAVNDDYCDCEDGSDEPGTSACSNGIFYCANKGHIPGFTLSSRVNDGVCEPECCDGSDEYSGRVSCPDTCAALSEEYNRNRKKIVATQRAGYAIRQEYGSKGRKLKADRQAEVEMLKAELETAKMNVARAQSAKEQTENDEQERKALQESSQCKFKKNFGRCVDHLRQAVNRLQEHSEQITTLRGLLSSMKRDHNQNYHDMAVKEAIKGYDEFVDKHPDFPEESKDAIDAELLVAIENLEAVKDSVGAEQGENSQPDGRSEENENVGFSSWALGVVTRLQAAEIVTRPFQSIMRFFTGNRSPSLLRGRRVSATPPLRFPDPAAASSAHSAAVSKQADIERKISDLNKKLEVDFGKDEEWAAIDGEQVENTFGKYTYEIHLFGEASQKSKDGEVVSIGFVFDALQPWFWDAASPPGLLGLKKTTRLITGPWCLRAGPGAGTGRKGLSR
ncbi:MAG: glucosidase II beta subunit-like-domain-containing protein [Olpidium bornovanus]|uniref:Glucosidase II beta subunit-like-domain-containing protein n=1 Tax=Olpidium bornovanus TaxID=278681 RepID=A0A8H7ZSS0_9FUNG|nr:MAG: glucosidase II beta subunit-like-domain-containing protein [Olpidium bornovanus]